MDINDTNILIYHDSASPGIEPQTSVKSEKKKEGYKEFLDRIRFYNKEGPHYIYTDNSDYSRKLKDSRRLIKKSGKYNVSRHVESQIWDKYLRDLCNTLVHSRWRWTIITASSSFILSWLIFAVIWMLIANANGDQYTDDPNLKCLLGINSFAGFFLFSLETQATIGYGTRSLGEHCPEGAFIICLQIVLGVGICGIMINIVYIKMTKPQDKYSKLFSKHAVICRRDGELCLIFRVRDEDSRHAIGTIITAYVLRKDKETGEPFLENIPLEPYGFLIWPLEIVHKITPTSPLWDISSYNLLSDKFEIIVTLLGTSPTTALCSRTRTSYISSEILWGHKFKSCVKFTKKESAYVVIQKNFNLTEEHSTHLCSAKRFGEVYTSLSPTPKNYNFKLNILYNGIQKRGTLVSVESIDSTKFDEQSETSKDTKGKPASHDAEKSNESVDLRASTHSDYQNLLSKINAQEQNGYQDPYDKKWDYQNYAGNPLPDFWLKEAASLPLINNYDQDPVLETRKFASEDHRLKANALSTTSNNLTKNYKEILNIPGVFEGEEFVFENNTSAEQSNMSLVSADYRKSDAEFDAELDAMLKSMESFLEEHFSMARSNSVAFPKSSL